MARSMALGHCICDVRQACPCEVFRTQDLCPCAGERPEPVALSSVRLTEWVHNAGCASKIAPADLEAVLRRLPPVQDPAVISGLAAADDAALYRIADGLCLVQTVDVFTPCVDDPRLFGRICAANCLSDIYAMGGQPRTALSILGFPSEKLDGEIMFQMLAGAMETLAEAGVALVGGHSIKEDEIKLGFAITGTIDPAQAAALDRPQAGDVLVLTKPLGTGVLTFAHQIGRDFPEGLSAATAAMATLNKPAAEAMREAGASACTDVTGFGLFAHLARMLRAAGLSAEIDASRLPAFAGVLEALRAGVIPGAIERNREFLGENLEVAPGVDEALVNLGFDAQTSGGLLIAVPEARYDALQGSLSRRGVLGHRIGSIIPKTGVLLRVTGGEVAPRTVETAATRPPVVVAEPSLPLAGPAPAPACCCEAQADAPTPSNATDSQRAFAAFLRTVQAAGALDEKTKELILFSLVLQSRCGPCFDAHFERALELGITRAQMDEAAWCAILLGGAPVRMFYRDRLVAQESAAGKATP